MSQLKKGNWTPTEDKRLLKVKKSKNSTEELKNLAQRWSRDYKNVYNHWQYLHYRKSENNEDYDGVMEFTIDTTIKEPARSDSSEVARMKRGLDLVIPKLTVNGGSIPISNKLANSAKRYLIETYTENKFTISRQREKGKETGFSRIFKRK